MAVEENRGLSARSAKVLRLIARGSTYEQILSLCPGMTYLDIFAAAREALDAADSSGYPESASEDREARAYERWNAAEVAELAQLTAGGESVESVAARLRRQQDAVRARMLKLNLIEGGM